MIFIIRSWQKNYPAILSQFIVVQSGKNHQNLSSYDYILGAEFTRGQNENVEFKNLIEMLHFIWIKQRHIIK